MFSPSINSQPTFSSVQEPAFHFPDAINSNASSAGWFMIVGFSHFFAAQSWLYINTVKSQFQDPRFQCLASLCIHGGFIYIYALPNDPLPASLYVNVQFSEIFILIHEFAHGSTLEFLEFHHKVSFLRPFDVANIFLQTDRLGFGSWLCRYMIRWYDTHFSTQLAPVNLSLCVTILQDAASYWWVLFF